MNNGCLSFVRRSRRCSINRIKWKKRIIIIIIIIEGPPPKKERKNIMQTNSSFFLQINNDVVVGGVFFLSCLLLCIPMMMMMILFAKYSSVCMFHTEKVSISLSLSFVFFRMIEWKTRKKFFFC